LIDKIAQDYSRTRRIKRMKVSLKIMKKNCLAAPDFIQFVANQFEAKKEAR